MNNSNTNQTNSFKYFLYARKSSEGEDRQVASIDDQIQELKVIAQREGLNIVEILSEAKSAKEPMKRIVFNDMIERIKEGEADAILCWKLDRLARNPVDGGTISWLLQNNTIKNIKTFEKNYYPTDNVLMMGVEFGMANQYIRDLSVNCKRGLRQKAERGWYPQHPPTGYRHTPNLKKGEKEIEPDNNFNLVKKAFKYIISEKDTASETYRLATEKWGLRKNNGKTLAKSTFYRMLKNPFYYGKFEYPADSGNWYNGKHRTIITKEEYNKLQNIMNGNSKSRPKYLDFPYKGQLTCTHCGCLITAEKKKKVFKNGNQKEYTYYHCTHKKSNIKCHEGSIEEQTLEKEINSILGNTQISHDLVDWAVATIQKKDTEDYNTKEEDKIYYEKQIKQYNKKIDGLIDMRSNGEINDTEFLRHKQEINKELKNMNDSLESLNKKQKINIDQFKQLYTFSETAQRIFRETTEEGRKNIFLAIGSNLSLSNKKLLIKGKNYLSIFSSFASEEKKILTRLEPTNFSLTKQQKTALYNKNRLLLRLWDEVGIYLIQSHN